MTPAYTTTVPRPYWLPSDRMPGCPRRLPGIEEGATVGGFCRAVRENHSGCLNCRDLLRMNREAGRPQKPHCDDMVYECTALVEQILQEKK